MDVGKRAWRVANTAKPAYLRLAAISAGTVASDMSDEHTIWHTFSKTWHTATFLAHKTLQTTRI